MKQDLREIPCTSQLEKAYTLQRRPRAAKILKRNKKNKLAFHTIKGRELKHVVQDLSGKTLCSWYCLGAEVMLPTWPKICRASMPGNSPRVAHRTCKYPVHRISQPSKQPPHRQTQTGSVSSNAEAGRGGEPPNCLPARPPPCISSIAGLSFTPAHTRKR